MIKSFRKKGTKVLAKEILIFFGAIVFFVGVSVVYYFTHLPPDYTKYEKYIVDTNYASKPYILRLKEKPDKDNLSKFEPFINLDNDMVFVTQLRQPEISRRFFDSLHVPVTYIYKGKTISDKRLKNKFGDDFDDIVLKYGFQPVIPKSVFTYSEMLENIQNDSLSEAYVSVKKRKKLSQYQNHTEAKFIDKYIEFNYPNFALWIFILVYPIRFSGYVLKWSIAKI